MAIKDLHTELQKDALKLDEETERKVVKMSMNLLQDKNGEVQNEAVRCLGPLVGLVKEAQVEFIVDTLCSNMTTLDKDKEQLRDISSIGLKTVITELPQTQTGTISLICRRITTRLIDAVTQKNDVTVQLESLDILADLLNRFGNTLSSFHTPIQEALLPQLCSPRLAVRKRSITAISNLLMSSDQAIVSKTIDQLLGELLKHKSLNPRDINVPNLRTYIQCIAAIARHAGHRFGNSLPKLVPIIVHFATNIDDDELKEYCIQALEAFIRKCPKEVTPFVPQVIEISSKYLCYDPNYNYDDGEDDEMEMEMEEDNESNDEYSDDDDMSWKVRRASAKCLEAVIVTRHEMVVDLYQNVSPLLISRFKEREENVKVDIFSAYVALLKQTRGSSDTPLLHANNGVDNGMTMEEEDSAISLLQGQVKDIVRALHKMLREKSVKTRQGAFILLAEVLHVLPSSLRDDTATLIPGILYSMSDKNSTSNMKIDALSFLNSFLKCSPPEVFQPHTQTLLPAVMAAVGDTFYKISSEALLVLTQLVRVIRPTPGQDFFPFHPYVKSIYECTFSKLKATDIDQEVKERAITCMGHIVATFGDCMSQELTVCLPVLLDRLKNEITRLTCVKGLIGITSSVFKMDLSPLLPEAFPILASFLRKNQRALKLQTLILLDTLCKNYGPYLDHESITIILNEVPVLINESDLHVSQLTLVLLTSLIRSHSEMQDLAIIPHKILPEALHLVRSPLLQGVALQSVMDFFQALVTSSFPGLDHQELIKQLTLPVYVSSPNPLHKHAYVSIARCVAAITIIDGDLSHRTIISYLNDLSKQSLSDAAVTLVFLIIGEIGKAYDTSQIPQLGNIIVSAFDSPSEDVKSAASFALGSVSVGNLQHYLPFVLREIESKSKRQYLLLHSLKEIISCQSINSEMIRLLQPHLDSIWNILVNHCVCPEEGTRNVVAECLGKLTMMNPEVLLPRLQTILNYESSFARGTAVTAVKFTISDQPQAIDPLLKNCIGDFFNRLEDTDISVRRVALITFNSAAHNKPSLIRDLLPTILPRLYKETEIRQELIREVEMGPFKHTVDDGLDIRKAAFECMYTLLDSCLDRLDIFEFLSHVEAGLRDHYDIKMLTYLMLVRLSVLCPSAVLNRMDRLIEPLKITCTAKVKANAVKQEFEKQDELKRSALRAFLALLLVPDAVKCPQVNDLLSVIRSTSELQALFDQIQKDSCAPDSATSPMDVS